MRIRDWSSDVCSSDLQGSHEEDHSVLAGDYLGRLRPIRGTSESCRFGGKHSDGGRTGGQPRPAQGTAPAMQDRPLQAGRRAVQPGSRSHAQTVLWRRRNALHTAERVAKVLIVGRSPIRLHFFLDTPQCARACGVFLWLATALILSFSSTFLL